MSPEDPADTDEPVWLESVRVRGFRGLVDTSLTLQQSTTVLLGENNSGKTSVLHALACALRARQATEEDLHVPVDGARTGGFTVDLALRPAAGSRFAEGPAAVLGQAITRDAEGAELVALRAAGSPAPDGDGVRVDHVFLRGWPMPGASEPETMAHPLVTSRTLELIDFTLLDAQRDLVEQLRQRRSTWGRLLSRLEISPEVASAIEQQLQQVGDQVIDASPVLADIRDQLRGISGALGASVGDVSLAPLPPRVDELARGIDVLLSSPETAAIPLRLQGMGSRSLAALMVFRAFTALRLGADLPQAPTPVIALEEPEAHLHPQAHAAVTTLIQQMPGQKIVSTHSPRVARAVDLSDLRHARRRGTHTEVCAPGAELYQEERTRVRRLVVRPYGEALFARLVVVGDGATEAGALPVFMQARWATDPEGLGVAVVEVPSMKHADVPPLMVFLEQLDIPWLWLVDGDQSGEKAVTNLADRLERDLSQAPQLVRLPSGQAFERHLLAEGHAEAVREGIDEFYGSEALEEYATATGFGGDEEELLFRFLRHNKGTYGAAVARAIVSRHDDEGRPMLPSGVRQLLERAEGVLQW